jgi:16S rRNA G966 N2-methylase RsmD
MAIAPDALIAIEHASKAALPPSQGRLNLLRQYRYGDTTLSLFEAAVPGTPAP